MQGAITKAFLEEVTARHLPVINAAERSENATRVNKWHADRLRRLGGVAPPTYVDRNDRILLVYYRAQIQDQDFITVAQAARLFVEEGLSSLFTKMAIIKS